MPNPSAADRPESVAGVAPADVRPLLAILAVAAAVRAVVAYGLLGDMALQSDALQYATIAAGMVERFPGDAHYFWPPGLLYYLAAMYSVFGDDVFVSRAAMIVLGVASTAAVVAVSRRAFRSAAVAHTAGLVAALYPASVLMSGQTYAQELASLSLLVVAWAVLALVERPSAARAAVAGLALGVGILTRPSTMSVLAILAVGGLLLAAWRLRSGERARAAATAGATLLAAGLAVACLLPAMAHNARFGQGWSLSTNNEMNVFMGNNPYTHYYKTSHLAQRSPDLLEPEVAAYLNAYLHAPNPRAAMREAALDYVLAHPVTTAWRSFSRLRAFWGFDYIMSRAIQQHAGGSAAVLLAALAFEAGGYLLVMLAVISGAIIAVRAGLWLPCALLALVVLAYQAPYALAFSSGTYHFPVMGLLFPVAALNVTRRWRESPALRPGERAVFFGAALVLALIQLEYGWHAAQLAGPG